MQKAKTMGIGNPLKWKAIKHDNTHVERGGRLKVKKNEKGENLLSTSPVDPEVEIMSPVRIPAGAAKKFVFEPVEPGWPGAEIDLGPDEILDYAMTRQATVGVVVEDPGVSQTETLCVRVGKKRISTGEILERKWLLPDGRVIDFIGTYEALETLYLNGEGNA